MWSPLARPKLGVSEFEGGICPSLTYALTQESTATPLSLSKISGLLSPDFKERSLRIMEVSL